MSQKIKTKPLIPIVNKHDEIVGFKHRHELALGDIYRAAALWATNPQGDILIAQRALSKRLHPGKWGPAAAGTVEIGEGYDDNITKEAGEELGLIGSAPQKDEKVFTEDPDAHDYFCQWYRLVVDQPAEVFNICRDEVAQVRWIGPLALHRQLALYPDEYLNGFAEAFGRLSPSAPLSTDGPRMLAQSPL